MIKNIILVLLACGVVFLATSVNELAQHRKECVVDNAEINSIKYGLFNVNEWTERISDILAKKIQEFEFDEDSREDLNKNIQAGLYQLINQIEDLLNQKIEDGRRIEKLILNLVEKLIFDLEDLREKVPEFTELIIKELNKKENRVQLKSMIQEKLDETLYKVIGFEKQPHLQSLLLKYEKENLKTCSHFLVKKVIDTDQVLWERTIYLLGLLVVGFLVLVFWPGRNFFSYLFISCMLLTLLYLGVTISMIEIDARIASFGLELFCEPLEFTNQVLFYQSKSIYEVVNILTSTQETQAVMVGVLIFIFSIIFPIIKIITSLVIVKFPRLVRFKFLKFFAIKSGKWSMADVFVVAIFMAFIGFQGVIAHQLGQLKDYNPSVEVITTDNSSFGVGFIMFLAFCLFGLVLSTLIEKDIHAAEETP